MLKKLPYVVHEALSIIFNKSLSTGIFPDNWKSAIVVPMHKKGDIYNLNNYRPISLLPVISKVFERLVDSQLRTFIESYDIPNETQHGYKKSRSCETALLQLSKCLFSLKASKQFSYMIAFDFSKAFDTLNHTILLYRIFHFSNSLTSSWFMSFLLNRNQCTKYCDVISDPRNIDTGVPQGSVLSAILFTLYINDLLKTLPPASSIAYADDVTIICHGDNQANAAANAVNVIASVIKWAQENGLILNSRKSQAIFISPYARKKFTNPSVLTSSATCISIVPDIRVLGIIITQDFKWATRATRTQKSVAKMLDVLIRFGSALKTNCRCRILQTFILPKLSHCTPVWCWVSNPVVNALDTTLQCAAHFVLRQKIATLDINTYETTGTLPFRMYTQYKCF